MLIKFIVNGTQAVGPSESTVAHPGAIDPHLGPSEVIVDGVRRVEYGGPINPSAVEPFGCDRESEMIPDERSNILAHALDQVPHRSGDAEFTDVCGRGWNEAPGWDLPVWWVRTYADVDDVDETATFLYNGYAYLCDDRGNTIERLGPHPERGVGSRKSAA